MSTEPLNRGKRAIATLPSGQQIIRDFPAGMEPCGFGWRLTWAAPSPGFRDGWSRDLGEMVDALRAWITDYSRQGCTGMHMEHAPMIDTGRPAGDLAAFLAGKA